MNEYTKQAEDFLQETGAKFEIEYIGLDKPAWGNKEYRQSFKFTISKGNRKYSNIFYASLKDLQEQAWKVQAFRLSSYTENTDKADSFQRQMRRIQEFINNILKGAYGISKSFLNKYFCPATLPSAYDILAGLTKSDPGTIDDFISEYGYTPSKECTISQIIRTYEAVKVEYQALVSIFSDSEMEKLAEIA